MADKNLYRLLEQPFVYRLSQLLLAPGAEKRVAEKLRLLKSELDIKGTILDVGCGPQSWLTKIGVNPVGLDISYQYSAAYNASGTPAITGSATALPFADHSLDSIWCIGVLHHLSDAPAQMAAQEMLRVCRLGGQVVIMDAVLPVKTWHRPLASLIRSLDRGKFMRSQKQLQDLLPGPQNWKINRYTYAATGLEMLECIYQKPVR